MQQRRIVHVGVVLVGLLATAVPGVHAETFDWGPVSGSFDSTISLGTSVRMEDPDPARIGITNGGTARTVNEDEGNLNFGRGDVLSAAAKLTHDLELGWGDFSVFGRYSYFFDDENDAREIQTAGDQYFGPRAKDRLGKDAGLLDLYARASLHVADRPLSVRAGRQVINWGESTFIGNGISVINPIDVAKIRTPGAEVKEALIPSPMVWVSFGATEALSLEALWIASYDKTRIDPRGSFFSTNDFISDDGDNVYAGFGRRKDQHDAFTSPASDPEAQVWVPRAPSPDVEDPRKQYGAALRYFAEGLNNTEFGLYYLQYHSRTPLVSAIRGTASNMAAGTGTARYFDEYPEAIDLYGVSFNTSGPFGLALQGETSYRPNQPTQLGSIELLLSALGLANNITGDATAAAAVPAGTVIPGYRRVDLLQTQVTATKAFGPTLGASQFVLLGEAGYNHQDLPDDLLFNAPGIALPAPGSANAAGGVFQDGGYATRSSWGYRLLTRMDFENVIGPTQVSPRLVAIHDVNGVGPNFNEGTGAASLGIGFNYLQNWQADIAYTAFFGGRKFSGTQATAPPAGQSATYSTHANPNVDRDFLAVSVSYSF
jgi:hypothetical protein